MVSQVLCLVLGNSDSKDTTVSVLMEFRTSGATETKVKKKCGSVKGDKEKIQRPQNKGDKRRRP